MRDYTDYGLDTSRCVQHYCVKGKYIVVTMVDGKQYHLDKESEIFLKRRSKRINMKNRNGLTLIELLAVIVILAVATSIVSLIIMNVIEDSKKGALKDSAYGILKAGELRVAKSQDLNDYTGEIIDITDGTLEYKGTIPNAGIIVIRHDGKMKLEMNHDKWCITKDYEEPEVTFTKKTSDCDGQDLVIQSGIEAPVLQDGMIPVTFDENGNTIKADINRKWYDYKNKQWANAVSVTSSSRSSYQSATPGTTIKEDDILAYFVWIPRYRYRLWNAEYGFSEEQEIQIRFEKKEVMKSEGSKNDQWLTHPAFTFGDTELAGIWVGKFETTGSYSAPTIKPNKTSYTNSRINMVFQAIRKFSTTNNYGLSSYDSHMMKNIEWGAVAYLTNSQYGRCTNGTCSDIWINNANIGYGNDTFNSSKNKWGPGITGCAGVTSDAKAKSNLTACESGFDYKQAGVNASTTGNITGIYDMSGGVSETVMAVMKDETGNILYSNSGFSSTSMPNLKYYDLYEFSDEDNDLTIGKLGDATREMIKEKSGWYHDTTVMPRTSIPWFSRGGDMGNMTEAGLFAFARTRGDTSSSSGSRVVVVFE